MDTFEWQKDGMDVDMYGRWVQPLVVGKDKEGKDYKLEVVHVWNETTKTFEPQMNPSHPERYLVSLGEVYPASNTNRPITTEGFKPKLVDQGAGSLKHQYRPTITTQRGGRETRKAVKKAETPSFLPLTYGAAGIEPPLDSKGNRVLDTLPIGGINGDDSFFVSVDPLTGKTYPSVLQGKTENYHQAYENGPLPASSEETAKVIAVGAFRFFTDPFGTVVDLSTNGVEGYLHNNLDYSAEDFALDVVFEVGLGANTGKMWTDLGASGAKGAAKGAVKSVDSVATRLFTPDHTHNLHRQASRDAYLAPANRQDIGAFKYDKDLSNEETAIYHNDATQETLVAHRGSVTAEDWLISDVGIASGTQLNTPRFKRSLDLVQQAHDKYGFDVITSGHSLAGNLVYATTYTYGQTGWLKEGVAFNAGTSPISPYKNEAKAQVATSLTTTHRVFGDGISANAPPFGTVNTYSIPTATGPLQKHSMDAFDLEGTTTTYLQEGLDYIQGKISKKAQSFASKATKRAGVQDTTTSTREGVESGDVNTGENQQYDIFLESAGGQDYKTNPAPGLGPAPYSQEHTDAVLAANALIADITTGPPEGTTQDTLTIARAMMNQYIGGDVVEAFNEAAKARLLHYFVMQQTPQAQTTQTTQTGEEQQEEPFDLEALYSEGEYHAIEQHYASIGDIEGLNAFYERVSADAVAQIEKEREVTAPAPAPAPIHTIGSGTGPGMHHGKKQYAPGQIGGVDTSGLTDNLQEAQEQLQQLQSQPGGQMVDLVIQAYRQRIAELEASQFDEYTLETFEDEQAEGIENVPHVPLTHEQIADHVAEQAQAMEEDGELYGPGFADFGDDGNIFCGL